MNNKIKPKEYISPIAIAPGETIKEILDEISMSQKELAARLGITEKHLTHVINGKAEISRELADKLELVLGIDAIFWLNLENEYRETLKKTAEPVILDNEEEIAKIIPYSELAKRRLVQPTRKIKEKVVQLRQFFGISDLNNIPKVNAAYRKANNIKENKYAIAAWIRIAELQAKNIETDKFNRKKLIAILPKIRELTLLDPDKFFGELVELMASCGIALVLSNHLSGTGIHGVTFLSSKRNKLIIQLSVRRKYADTFWFTLFHEIAHIVSDETGSFNYIDCDETVEREMDIISRNILIPEEKYTEFINNSDVDETNYYCIREFAESIGIHPCIVIGRLKYDGVLQYCMYTDKTPKFEIIE